MSQLAIGWQVKRLGDVLELKYGKPLPKEQRDDNGEFPAYGANGIKCRTNQFYWDKPTIIVGRKGSAGEVNLTESKFWPLDVTYFVDFDENQYDLFFLHFCLISLNLPKLAKGVKPGINRNDVYSIEFAFPPLPEQKRTVAILDELFEGITQTIATTEKNIANARELFESYLNSVFAQEGEEWIEKPFGSICDFVRGPFGGSLKKTCFVDDGYAVYEQQHAINNQFDEIRYYVDENKFGEMSRFELRSGDLIMSCSGTMGRVAIAPRGIKRGIINQALLKLSPSRDLVAEFLKYWMASRRFQEQIAMHSKGVAIKNVASVKVLKKIDVPIPNISVQKKIVSRLNSFLLQTKHLESIYQKKLDALAELKQSILQKAFTGELTN